MEMALLLRSLRFSGKAQRSSNATGACGTSAARSGWMCYRGKRTIQKLNIKMHGTGYLEFKSVVVSEVWHGAPQPSLRWQGTEIAAMSPAFTGNFESA